MSHLFIQVTSQDICFIEEGDITFPPGETFQRSGRLRLTYWSKGGGGGGNNNKKKNDTKIYNI